LILISSIAYAGKPANPQLPHESSALPNAMAGIVSPDEAVRFQLLEKAKIRLEDAPPSEIEILLTSFGKKNVSTLLFVLMKTRNDGLYHVSTPARMAAENSDGSFPNIAYYYARVNPSQGIESLFRLYDRHKFQRLPICMGIGLTQSQKGVEFLLNEAKRLKPLGEDIYAQISGLKTANYRLDTDEIKWFLNTDLNREEFIAITQLQANVSRTDLIDIYHASMIGRSYAIQHVFGYPDLHMNALQDIISAEIEKGRYQYVYQLMMSDRMRTTQNRALQEFREKTISQVTPFLENPPSR